MDDDSAEYRALVCLTPALESAVETQVTSLGRELVAVGFITSDEYEWLTRYPFQRTSDQAANLVRLIIQRVRQDSQSYQKFIGVLQTIESIVLYVHVL